MARKHTSLASYPQRANAGLYTLSKKSKFMTQPIPFPRLIKEMRADTEYFGPLGPKVKFFTQNWLKMLDDERYIDYDEESQEIHIRDSAKAKFRDVREEMRTVGLSSKKEKRLGVAKRLNMGCRLGELTKAELLRDNTYLRNEKKRLETRNEELEAQIASGTTQIASQLSFAGTGFQQDAGMETGPEQPEDMEGIEEISEHASPAPTERVPTSSSPTQDTHPESDPFASHASLTQPQTQRKPSVHAAYPTPVSAPRFGSGAPREPPTSPTPSGGSFVQRGEEGLGGLQSKVAMRRECSQRLHEFAGATEKWTPSQEQWERLDAGLADIRVRGEDHHHEVLRLMEESRRENKQLHQQTQADSAGQWAQIMAWGKDFVALVQRYFDQGQANHVANLAQFQVFLDAGERRELQVAELGAAQEQHFQATQADGAIVQQHLQDLTLAHQRTYDLVQALEERVKASGEQMSAQTARIDAFEANRRLCEELQVSKLELQDVERELEEAREQRGTMAQERDSLAAKLGETAKRLTEYREKCKKVWGIMGPMPDFDTEGQGVAV